MPTSAPSASCPQDQLLLEQLRAGDSSAFDSLIRSFAGYLLASARRLLPLEDDARGAVRDAFFSASKALPVLQGQIHLGNWLQRFLVRAVLARLRARPRVQERSIDELLPKFVEDGRQAQPAREWSLSSARRLERPETRALLGRAIAQLPETYRTVLWLRDIEGLDTDEAGALLEINGVLIKTRLHRARQALRGLLDEHFGGDGPC